VRFSSFVRAVTANPGLKIVSLLFAVFLWLYVTAQVGGTETFTVPLLLSNIPDSLIVVNEVPDRVEITVRGGRSELLKLRVFGKVQGVVDLAASRRGETVVRLTPGILRLPAGFKSDDAAVDSPKSLMLVFEPVVRRYVPVTAVFERAIPRELILVSRPVVTPERVLAAGAGGIMDGVRSVETQPIRFKGGTGRYSRRTALRPGARVEVIPGEVLVEFEIARRAVRTIEGIPPTLLQQEEGLVIEYAPRVASLTVEGPEDLVKRLVPDDVSIIISIAEGARGAYRIEPEVIVPQGIDTFTLNVDSFEVHVAPRR